MFPKFDEIGRRPPSIFIRGVTSLEGYCLSPEQSSGTRAVGPGCSLEAGLGAFREGEPSYPRPSRNPACAPQVALWLSPFLEEHTGLTPARASAGP